MALEQYSTPADLYLSRGSEVATARPIFTGDVFESIAIPGVQEQGMAMVVAHPCSIRGAGGQLLSRIPMASVTSHQSVPPTKWSTGFFDRMPLPELIGEEFHAANFALATPVDGALIESVNRIACLSAFGVNILQQRMIWHLTRFEVPTHKLHEAFSHTLEEADLLEEWTEHQIAIGVDTKVAAADFEEFIRSPADTPTGPTLQDWLKEPQRRAPVRSRMRATLRNHE